MAPPHTATTTTSKVSNRPALPKRPVLVSHIPFKARLIPPHPAFNCSDENIIKLYLRVQEGEAMKRLRRKEVKIRAKFLTKEEEILENFRQEREASKILDGVSESLARMKIDRNLLKEDVRRSQQGCAVPPRKHNKKSAVDTLQDDEMQFRNDLPPYGDQSSYSSIVVMRDGKENGDNYPPPGRGCRKDILITPRSTFPPTNRTGPNEGTENAPPVFDTLYSLFTLEQDLATSTNIEQFFFERPPLLPITPTAENSLRLKLRTSSFKSDFPGISSTPNKDIGRSHSPGQQQSSSFFADELDESEKENLDELAVLRQQQQQHLLFATPATATVSTATTATSKPRQNSLISSCSAPCSPTRRKREHDEISDDLDGGMTTTTTPFMNTLSSPASRQISGLVTSSIALPQPLAYHGSQHHSPDADIRMSMEQEPQAKRARLLLNPPAGLESSKASVLLRDSKGLFGPQSLVIR